MKLVMQVHITARKLQLTAAIRAYVEEKLQKAEKYFNHIVWAQAILTVEKRAHQAEVVIHAARQTFRASAQGTDLYAAVDLVSDKIDAQLKKYKERLRSRHKKGVLERGPEFIETIDPIRFSVVKQVSVRPITREKAAEEMESMGYDFWVFMDKDSKQVQVVYRRQDNSLGILQPVKWNGK